MPEFLTPPKEVLAVPVTGTPVNHPIHNGGADNPFETIKVLEARLSPVEFAGFCRGNVYVFNDRASATGKIVDLEKAQWYQARLISFAKEHGQDAIVPPQFFWNNAGVIFEDDFDLIASMPSLYVIAIHSNQAPHTRWAVKYLTSEDGDTDIQFFSSPQAGIDFIDVLDPAKPARTSRRSKPKRRRVRAK